MKAITHKEEDRTKAAIVSVLLHAVLLAFLFLWHITQESPVLEAPPIVLDWGGGGDNAAAGTPDAGQGDNPSDLGQQLEDPDIQEPTPAPAESTPPPQPSAAKPVPAAEAPKKVVTSEDPNVAALRRSREEARQRQQQEAERQRQQALEAERERQRIAQAEADRKRREQEEYDKKKGQFGGAFGGGSGTGSGNTGKPGNQGQPGGTGNNPFGQGAGDGGGSGGGSGTGTGVSIGGGLSGRKLVARPRMSDNSQKTGKVMVEVCVDGDGNVISAVYTMSGSTTNDGELRNKAVLWAKQHKFAPSTNPKECGTFAFNFQLK